MWDIWSDLTRINKMYPSVRKIPLSYPMIRRSEHIEKIDNGYILDFLYTDLDTETIVKARRFYGTEAELEQGIKQLKDQFAEELAKRGKD